MPKTVYRQLRSVRRTPRPRGVSSSGMSGAFDSLLANLPEDWLERMAERSLTEEEKARIEALGGWDKLLETLQRRLEEQKGRHQGGNKWIGTAGTSPFGAFGYNPEGVRIGQDESRNHRAVKVWDKREFQNLADTVELGTRNIKVALRKLRKFAREGAAEHLDLDVRVCEELFSAARTEFKHLEYFYFHNFVYESVWKDNRRRHQQKIPTLEVMRTYGHDYKLIVVGDATMSPYEIMQPGGSIEHWNEEAGAVWMQRLTRTWPHHVWLNPEAEQRWEYNPSVQITRQLMEDRMFPLTLSGLDRAIKALH